MVKKSKSYEKIEKWQKFGYSYGKILKKNGKKSKDVEKFCNVIYSSE